MFVARSTKKRAPQTDQKPSTQKTNTKNKHQTTQQTSEHQKSSTKNPMTKSTQFRFDEKHAN